MRTIVTLTLGSLLAALVVTAVSAGTVVGTPRNDVLRGSAKADRIDGRAGNDRLFGNGGDDVLLGGPGNDLLAGGPGKDRFSCGPGADRVLGDARDVRPGRDCEVVRGLPAPKLSIFDASAAEGDSGTARMSFVVTLSAASTQAVSVRFATADGTATAPSDFASESGTLTFAAGVRSKTIDVAVKGDIAFEPDETFTVNLSDARNAKIAEGSGTGTIQNDDPAAQPGHYEGQTSQNERFAFDVTAGGARLTGLTTGQINQSCTPSLNIFGNRLSFGSYSVPIAADGSFTIDVTLRGTVGSNPSTSHFVVTGRFSGASAAGTFLLTTDFTAGATSYACTSNQQTWTVARTG